MCEYCGASIFIQFYSQVKIDCPTNILSSVIYKFKCEECDSSYVGETVRHFIIRINEHTNCTSKESEVSIHAHGATGKKFKILFSMKKTKISESLTIAEHQKDTFLKDIVHLLQTSVSSITSILFYFYLFLF